MSLTNKELQRVDSLSATLGEIPDGYDLEELIAQCDELDWDEMPIDDLRDWPTAMASSIREYDRAYDELGRLWRKQREHLQELIREARAIRTRGR